MKILIVEDEDFSRQMLKGYLVQLGHEVATAANGAEAWQQLADGEIRMVITDWMMPGMDGLELVRLIRSRTDGPYIYIILLTSKTESRHVIQGIMDGADDYLTKPYDRDELDVRIRSGKRVIDLEESLSARNLELKTAKLQLEEINAALTQANTRMKTDLDAAARIQRSLLPTAAPDEASLDCAWVFRPCDELAGDIFDIFMLDDEHVGFYLLDVAGHGVPAALLSVTLSRILSPAAGPSSVLFSQNASGNHLKTPSEIALELNQRFQVYDDHEKFFTILLGLLNIGSGELRYVSAGNPKPVLVPRDQPPKLLDVGGLPVGVANEPNYQDEVLTLAPGDRIFLYSDGVLEAENCDGEYFGCDQLIKCVEESSDSLEATVSGIEERTLSWCHGRPQDDISVLAISILGAGNGEPAKS